jgi:hypothetical protein
MRTSESHREPRNCRNQAVTLMWGFERNGDFSPTLSYTPLTLMYRIVLACKGVPADVGAVAARDITEEFTHRSWHRNVHCEWDGSRLILQADNDFDSNGLALRDEFSDAISASITEGFDGDIDVVSVSPLAD